MGARLDEILLGQGRDVVAAGEFLKKLLDEPSIRTDRTLVNTITAWGDGYKSAILGHSASRNEVRTAASRFPMTKNRLFTRTANHQDKVNTWAETEDMDRANEPGDD